MSQRSQSLASHTLHELAIKPSISTLAQGSMFWQPEYREPSAWLEHLPFLFWLVEALRPSQSVELGVDLVPHFALCQAVTRLRLGTHCYTVGDGDAHQRACLDEYGAEHFAGTSHWMATSPTRAIQQFDEGSIDLLLLNVAADDDSIDYLLDRWVSRLSRQGVVLLPGIARREPGCQAFRIFDELKTRYPHFAFHHAGGLGVLMVGDTPPALLQNLLGTLESNASNQVVQDIFGRLGRSCQDKMTAQQQRALAQRLEAQVAEQAQQLTASQAAMEEQAEDVRQQATQAQQLQNQLTLQEERFAHERDRLAERINALEETRDALQQDLKQSRRQAEERERQRQQQVEALRLQESQTRQAHESNTKLQTSNEQQQHELGELRDSLKAREDHVQALTAELRKAEQTRQQLSDDNRQLAQQRENVQLEAMKHREEVLTLTHRLEESQQAAIEKDRQLAVKAQRLEKQTASLNERFEELDQLKRQLNEAETSHQSAQGEVSALNQQVDELSQNEQQAKDQLNQRFQELGKLTRMLEESQQAAIEKDRQLAVNADRLEELDQLKRQLNDVETSYQSAQNEVSALNQQVDELSQNEQQAKDQLNQRFQELAKLTRMLEEYGTQHKEHSNEQTSRLEQGEASELTRVLDDANQENQRQPKPAASSESEAPASGLGVRPAGKSQPLTRRAMKRQIALIEQSSLFDADWYLKQYPDIANDPKMSKQPARHYLVMGGFEGRDPSPHFASAAYLQTYPDVVSSGINPLVHFIKHGILEKREPRPSVINEADEDE